MRIRLSWRWARITLSAMAIVALACVDPQARPWIAGFGVFAGLATIVATAVRRRLATRVAGESRRKHPYGSFEATPSTITFTRYGKSQSIRWDEVESVAYGSDPMTQEPEWWLRGRGRADRLKSIPDPHADRSRLLSYFSLYLPGFDPDVFERSVLGAMQENPDAVVECWKRN
jgi:hypothetical protein